MVHRSFTPYSLLFTPSRRGDFVVQREVAPLLLDGRRFCVRQHVLLVVPPLDDDAAVDAVDAAGRHAETVAITENFILGSFD